MKPFRLVLLTSDKRECERRYDEPQPAFGTAPTGLLEGFRHFPNHIEVHVISCHQKPVSSPIKLAENIWFHALHVPKSGWLRSGYLGCILAVEKKLRQIQPDLVHAQGTERDCAMSSAFSGYRKLLTIHGNLRLIEKAIGFKPFSALWFQTRLESFVVKRFDGIICITRYTQSAIAHETPKTWVVPNAVDPGFLALGAERAATREDSRWEMEDERSDLHSPLPAIRHPLPTILVVATVDERKNQNDFIRSLDPLAGMRPFRVKFFGQNAGGEYGAEFDKLVADRSWCEFGGMIGRKELRDEFQSAHAVALPTHEDNCPMVVLEAQAAGLPVMASNVGGVPDLVEHEVTGLLTNPRNPESMRAAIERLLTDSELVGRLVTNGRRQAIEKFHPRVIAEQHLEIYREVIGGKG